MQASTICSKAVSSSGSSSRESPGQRHADIFRDPRLHSVQWRDLATVTNLEIVKELLLPAALLAASLISAATGHWVVALGFSFFFFLTGLRVVHNAFHGLLGLSRKSTEIILWVMSVLMLGSMHAVRFNHLRHHRLLMSDGDVEGKSADMPAWRVLLFGPAFPFMLHVNALKQGSRRLKTVVCGELALNVVWIYFALATGHSAVLRYHVSTMLVAQCLTAFFAVWTVHHHCDRSHYIARTLRNRIKNQLSFNMFLHIEHHLFPGVPTCHLPELSRRIDIVAPELKSKIVF